MELNDMTQHIDELHAKRDIKALKHYLNELNPADIAQLLEEIEDERKRIFFSDCSQKKTLPKPLLNLTATHRKT